MSRGCAGRPCRSRYAGDATSGRRTAHSRRERSDESLAGDADRDVEAAGHDVDDVIGEHEVDVDARIAFEKRGQHRRQVAHPERHRRIHAHEAVWFERLRGRLALDQFRIGEQPDRAVAQQFASRRERQLARRAVQQHRAEAFFEARDGLRHRRLRDAEQVGGFRERPVSATRAKMAQASRSGRCCMVGIHGGKRNGCSAPRKRACDAGILIRPGEKSLWNLIYFRWAPAC